MEFQNIGSLNEFERWVGFFNRENQLPVPSRFVHFKPNERHLGSHHVVNASFIADTLPFELSQLQASNSVFSIAPTKKYSVIMGSAACRNEGHCPPPIFVGGGGGTMLLAPPPNFEKFIIIVI